MVPTHACRWLAGTEPHPAYAIALVESRVDEQEVLLQCSPADASAPPVTVVLNYSDKLVRTAARASAARCPVKWLACDPPAPPSPCIAPTKRRRNSQQPRRGSVTRAAHDLCPRSWRSCLDTWPPCSNSRPPLSVRRLRVRGLPFAPPSLPVCPRECVWGDRACAVTPVDDDEVHVCVCVGVRACVRVCLSVGGAGASPEADCDEYDPEYTSV